MPGAASDAPSQNRLPDAALCRMSRLCDAATRSGSGGRIPGAASDAPAQNRLPDAVGCSMYRPCDAATRSGSGGRIPGAASDAPAQNRLPDAVGCSMSRPCAAAPGGKRCEEPIDAVSLPSSKLSRAFEKALKCSPISPSLR